MMSHIAIMKKSWKLTPKILTGEKKIETRWAINKPRYWNKVVGGDAIYFKDSGEPVTIKATITKVLYFYNFKGKAGVREIFANYWRDDGIEEKWINSFIDRFEDKRYAMIVFFENPEKIEPFEINKSGYGNMTAWISVEDIEYLKDYTRKGVTEGILNQEVLG